MQDDRSRTIRLSDMSIGVPMRRDGPPVIVHASTQVYPTRSAAYKRLRGDYPAVGFPKPLLRRIGVRANTFLRWRTGCFAEPRNDDFSSPLRLGAGRVGTPGQERLEQAARGGWGPVPEAAGQVGDGASEGEQPEAGADNSVDEVQRIGDRAAVVEGVAPLVGQFLGFLGDRELGTLTDEFFSRALRRANMDRTSREGVKGVGFEGWVSGSGREVFDFVPFCDSFQAGVIEPPAK